MSILDDILRDHRQRIIARERQTIAELLAAYDEIRREIQKAFSDLDKKIRAARAAGDEISLSWFNRENRLKALLAQVEEQITRFGGKVTPIVEREQRTALRIAVEQAADSLRVTANLSEADARLRSIGAQMNTKAIENAVGLMGDGSPLRTYFEDNLPKAVADAINREIVNATALGTDFNTLARRLRQAGDIPRYRAIATARTEVNRVRRETTRQIYAGNNDIVAGWEWVSAKSTRTCVVCLSLDGRQFQLRAPFPQHPQCRCTMIPVIFDVQRPPRLLGAEWFAGQPEHIQENMLGDPAFDAYSNGLVELGDFVGWKTDKKFGRSVYRRSLSSIFEIS